MKAHRPARSCIPRRGIAAEGAAVEVGKLDGHQKRIPARVVPSPFYDPRKERVQS